MMNWEKLGHDVVATVAFSAIGIVVFCVAFLVMVKLTPFSVRKEIEEDHNTALAIIMGAVIVGIALVIMGALLGG